MTKRYSEQFKQESIKYVQNHPEYGVAIVAKQLGVGYSTLDICYENAYYNNIEGNPVHLIDLVQFR